MVLSPKRASLISSCAVRTPSASSLSSESEHVFPASKLCVQTWGGLAASSRMAPRLPALCSWRNSCPRGSAALCHWGLCKRACLAVTSVDSGSRLGKQQGTPPPSVRANEPGRGAGTTARGSDRDLCSTILSNSWHVLKQIKLDKMIKL